MRSFVWRRLSPSALNCGGCCYIYNIYNIYTSRRSVSTPFNKINAAADRNKSSSSVKFMPPPQSPPSSQSSSYSSSVVPSPMADAKRPIRDTEELIVALVDVFVEYIRSLQCTDAQSNAAASVSPSGHIVPFYPPVSLRYMEQHCQALLCRLLPGGNVENSTPIPIIGEEGDEIAKRNRQVLVSRVQSSGVFIVSPPPQGMRRTRSQETGKSVPDHHKEDSGFVLRVKPGVRELAVLIASFLASLEPNVSAGVSRKPVPLAVVRQMALNSSSATFVRRDLSNDLKWLLLVYARDTFELTKKDTLVRLKDIPLSAPPSSPSCETLKSECNVPSMKPDAATTAKDSFIMSTNFAGVPAQVKDIKGVETEAETVVHMGKRFIAPAAMERYRLSQKLMPLLEFIPSVYTLTPNICLSDKKHGDNNNSDARREGDGDDDDEFVDFCAVHRRAVTRYPHLAECLCFSHDELERQREGLLLSALKSIGVEWRWGRQAHPVNPRQLQQQHQNQQLQQNALEMGHLFVRRRYRRQEQDPEVQTCTMDKNETSQSNHSNCLVRDHPTEEERTHLTDHRLLYSAQPSWWTLSCSVMADEKVGTHISNESSTGTKSDTAEYVCALDEWEQRAISLVQAATYNALLMCPPTDPLHTIYPLPHQLLYPAGACANAPLVRHLLRNFTPRQYENVHSTILLAAQGNIPPLLRHEVVDSIACLFYPFGHQGHGTASPVSSSDTLPCVANSPQSIVFNRYIEGFFASPLPPHPCRLCIRPRVLPEDLPLSFRRLLPARLVLEILCGLYRQLQHRAEEIGLSMDEDEDEGGEPDSDEESYLTFNVLREALHPASRIYIRDVLGDASLIPLLADCHSRLFRVRPMSWTVIGLTREGKQTARERLREMQGDEKKLKEDETHMLNSRPYRSRRTGCFFTDDTRQQLDAFVMRR